MPTTLTFEQHLAGLHGAMTAFAQYAGRAGLDVDVPACPDWTVRRLIGHQGAVHRWAAGAFKGEDLDWVPIEKAGRSSSDPVEWLRDGAIALVQTLVAAADDAEAVTFLHDAPPPRRFWARRQCHETTIHATDALAASLGRLVVAADTWITPEVAADGIDELLLGFVPRSKSRLRSSTPVTIAVVPTDSPVSFTVAVSEDAPVTTRVDGVGGVGDVATGDLTVTGTSAQLYLWLWNRTDELSFEATELWRTMTVI